MQQMGCPEGQKSYCSGSVADSPPFTEDDRRARPAPLSEDIQGGRAESKLTSEQWGFYSDETPFLPETVDKALQNFAKFWDLPRSMVTRAMLEHRSPSLGIAEWSYPELVVLDNEQIIRDTIVRENGGQCWRFGMDSEEVDIAKHNGEVAKLIDALGESGAGRRAVLKAIAGKQHIPITDEDELEKLYDGTSDRKLQVPPTIRDALHNIGLGDSLMPMHLITASSPEHSEVFVSEDAWQDIEFEVALDSGSVVHVCCVTDCAGYATQESPGSRSGQRFLMGDGGEIPN